MPVPKKNFHRKGPIAYHDWTTKAESLSDLCGFAVNLIPKWHPLISSAAAMMQNLKTIQASPPKLH
jgi:hypothetical protein